MNIPVWVGYCIHDHPQAAIVAEYATPKDVRDLRARFRLEMEARPVTMGGPCSACESTKNQNKE